jgi:putative PIN family toxin of toxin-antitoxin system
VRVFLDTNVLVSAFAARGLCADLLRLVLGEHALLTGAVNLIELRRVLTERLAAPLETIALVERALSLAEIVPTPSEVLPIDVRDADDAWVLASAVAGDAAMLVTGDQDLLVLGAAAPLPIVTPREAWIRLRGMDIR